MTNQYCPLGRPLGWWAQANRIAGQDATSATTFVRVERAQ